MEGRGSRASWRARKRARIMQNQPPNIFRADPCQGSEPDTSQHNNGLDPPPGTGPLMQGHDLPATIVGLKFAEARAAEVKAMLQAVSQKGSVHRVFQTLPHYMRRRAMSSNVKRLPRGLRAAAEKEVQGTQAKPVSKCRSRKARRQHRNLLEEYNRRQRRHVWLETHVWHAKRFHMKERWGYRLAERPSAKTFRISFRAMDQHCLLQDISYYSCIEVSGRQEDLLQRLCRLTSKEAGMTFASKECLGGRRQGSLVLYKVEGFPSKPLGPVTFIWRSMLTPVVEESKHRQLWIWIHPAMKKEVLEELQQVLGCLIPVPPKPLDESLTKPVPEGGSGNPIVGHLRRKKKRSRSAARPEKVLRDGTRHLSDPTSWRTENGDIVLTDLTMELVRLRLVGPLANCVLTSTLHVADLPQVTFLEFLHVLIFSNDDY
uniref:POP1 homolog, ribonuclease P/MRP subunit n=1 Tax=Eptatretus burgeri TaxID=7764 RepID=A0A8C4WWL5_EPTBU